MGQGQGPGHFEQPSLPVKKMEWLARIRLQKCVEARSRLRMRDTGYIKSPCSHLLLASKTAVTEFLPVSRALSLYLFFWKEGSLEWEFIQVQ